MTCEQINDDLSAYLDGELPATARANVESHLAACSACQALAKELKELAGAIRELPRYSAPASLVQAVHARVEASPPPLSLIGGGTGGNAVGASGSEFQPRSMWGPVAFGLVAVLMLFALAFAVMPALSNHANPTAMRSAERKRMDIVQSPQESADRDARAEGVAEGVARDADALLKKIESAGDAASNKRAERDVKLDAGIGVPPANATPFAATPGAPPAPPAPGADARERQNHLAARAGADGAATQEKTRKAAAPVANEAPIAFKAAPEPQNRSSADPGKPALSVQRLRGVEQTDNQNALEKTAQVDSQRRALVGSAPAPTPVAAAPKPGAEAKRPTATEKANASAGAPPGANATAAIVDKSTVANGQKVLTIERERLEKKSEQEALRAPVDEKLQMKEQAGTRHDVLPERSRGAVSGKAEGGFGGGAGGKGAITDGLAKKESVALQEERKNVDADRNRELKDGKPHWSFRVRDPQQLKARLAELAGQHGGTLEQTGGTGPIAARIPAPQREAFLKKLRELLETPEQLEEVAKAAEASSAPSAKALESGAATTGALKATGTGGQGGEDGTIWIEILSK